MGAATSVGANGRGPGKDSFDNGEGSGTRYASPNSPGRGNGNTLPRGITTNWKMIPDVEQRLAKLGCDNTLALSAGAKELYLLLEDPVGQKCIGAFAKKILTHESFFAWTDIQEYRAVPSSDYSRGMAIHIYHKYVKEGAVLQLGGIKTSEVDEIREQIELSKGNPDVLRKDFFDKVQYACFNDMYNNTFLRFKGSPEYIEMNKGLRQDYNRVVVDDFHYVEKLGEGGFGKVVHVIKKSTGTHLAMKIQLKVGLLDTFNDDPNRIDHERRVLAGTYHPFIVALAYAFQTEKLAIMVLDLVTGGDLEQAMLATEAKRLPEERVQFYCAEIILALDHLHHLGLMYRDLKPCNVLLCDDGHIKLADLGGVAEFAQGTCLDDKGRIDIGIAEATEIGSQVIGRQSEAILSNQHRRRSIMGTQGYMAPEMICLMTQSRAVRVGYTQAVDFWSLGVTTFKLLTGRRPFAKKDFEEFVEHTLCKKENNFVKYEQLLDGLVFPEYVSAKARDLLVRLLDGNEKTRIGSSPDLLVELKAHPFFEGIDWVKLSMRHHIPPYVPPCQRLESTPGFSTLQELMDNYKEVAAAKGEQEQYDWDQPPQPSDAKYFEKWDFVSMHTLKVEMGIANEISAMDSNFKVRQLMGDDSPAQSTSMLKQMSIAALRGAAALTSSNNLMLK